MHNIALCSGEPAGIGPDIILQFALQGYPVSNNVKNCRFITLGEPKLFEARAKSLGLDISIVTFTEQYQAENEAAQLIVLPIDGYNDSEPGNLDINNAKYVLNILDIAIKGCKDGIFSAMVTAPVQKSVINDAGFNFSGHTEYLADKTHTKKVVMMLANKQLRVCLATTHLPLSEVAQSITDQSLSQIIRIINHDFQQYFAIDKPRILACGLNPHAGENGHLGREELDIIIPCFKKLRSEGINIIGPLPADTLFTEKNVQQGDLVLAMYHDQGLPVLKAQGFGQSANITLGLPIIRTSVDHGTALDLAGKGNADIGSLITACDYALTMSQANY